MKKRDFGGQILGNAVKKFTQRVSGITMVFQNKKNQLISSKNVGRKAIIYVTQWCSIRFRATIDPITCRELAASPTQQPASLNDIKDKDKKDKTLHKIAPHPTPYLSFSFYVIMLDRHHYLGQSMHSCASGLVLCVTNAHQDGLCTL